jgi:hypothetical protein
MGSHLVFASAAGTLLVHAGRSTAVPGPFTASGSDPFQSGAVVMKAGAH